MDFTLPTDCEDYRARVARFVNDHILPLEADPANFADHGNLPPARLREIRDRVKAEGLWAPNVPKALGGLGLPFIGLAAAYEEMNRSVFGPACFNAAAPDDGNMRLLAQVGTPQQQDWWLKPVIAGEMRSAFAMTEPHPGAGSDPTMMITRAERTNRGYRIFGRKWFITGAEGAGRFILMARTSDDPRKGITAFLFDAEQPGWHIDRRIGIMGPEEHGGHCELVFDGLEIPDENVLMQPGDGFKVTQIRLGPARLTHCMRWLGLAKRCMEIATTYAREREGFGMRLANRETVQVKLGNLAHQIEIGRLLVMKAAWLLDQGDRAKTAVSMAKIHMAETLHRSADDCIQICGARGYSTDTVLEWIYRYARQARLVDGADEVHKMVLAGAYMTEGPGLWRWGA
ncbi:acyl-CoA dehydrogenase family protein [Limibaculum sp. M0105]|uniref:Acyl-CoA dehydrogenase family protein n=1 Tax=Thermohalobaculum xanthum TaxID=2753746 RepID=A0A8J7M873_9RHOB|nr:acyl-CoA dehydrogenase family protein [Thermohalobaculum xanthum]MBK0399697.1 acyl-CoA dehydrogenase family protein [Thermohalobaculum xanthum]